MIDIRIIRFQSSEKCSIEIENFEPKEGLEPFLVAFSKYLGTELFEWSRGWEFGIGYITFKEKRIMLVQSEFPHVFSFDCPDEFLAKELKQSFIEFLNQK